MLLLTKIAEATEKRVEESPQKPWWAVPAVAAALGLGTYGVMRHPFKAAKGTSLRKLQDLSRGEMYFDKSWLYAPNKNNKRNLYERISDWIDDAAFNRVPTVDLSDTADIRQLLARRRDPTHRPFVMADTDRRMREELYNPALGLYGGGKKSERSVKRLIRLLDDKFNEADLLRRYAPGTAPRTLRIEDVLRRYNIGPVDASNIERKLPKIQDALHREFSDKGYILKTRRTRGAIDENVDSAGFFPTDKHNLVEEYKLWNAMKPQFISEKSRGLHDAIRKYRGMPGYRGRVIDAMVDRNVIVQEKIPLATFRKSIRDRLAAQGTMTSKEYRVHTLAGEVPGSLAFPRTNAGGDPVVLSREVIQARRAAKWFRKNVVSKLPEEFKNLNFGADIAKGPDGKFHVIELNTGGDSGFLSGYGVPSTVYKTITGRSTPARAIAGSIGSGIVGGGLTAAGVGTGLVTYPVSRTNKQDRRN